MDGELKAYLDGMKSEMQEGFAEHGKQIAEQGKRIDDVRTELSGKIDGVRDELGGKIEDVRDELGGKIDGVRDELGGKIDDVHKSIQGLSGVVEQNMKASVEADEVGERRRVEEARRDRTQR